MVKRYYPGVLERGAKGAFGAWFPDFPDCVAAGHAQEEAILKAELAVAHAVDALAEQDRPLPEPTRINDIVLPKGCRFVAYFVVGVEPPDPSERVNIYLPKSLIARADARAAGLGMSRSSFFGLALNVALHTMTSLAPNATVLAAAASNPRSKTESSTDVPQAKPGPKRTGR